MIIIILSYAAIVAEARWKAKPGEDDALGDLESSSLRSALPSALPAPRQDAPIAQHWAILICTREAGEAISSGCLSRG